MQDINFIFICFSGIIISNNMPKYQYLVENSNNNFSDALIITLKPKTAQDVFNFKPGQYVMLSFYDLAKRLFINHPFSIASSPTNNNNLVFGIRVMGKFTQTLSKLPLGTQIEVLGPFGNFVFDETKYPEAVFIAGGVGITPFISAAKYAYDKALNNKLTLLYSSRNVKEALFYEDIKQLSDKNPNFSAKLLITNETVAPGTAYCENGKITKDTISASINSVANKDFFLCGPGPFMKAMEDNLVALGVSKNKIHQEAFSVTQDLSLKKNFKNAFLAYGFSVALFIFALIFVSGGFTEKEKVETSEKPAKKISIDLINTTLNNRRNEIINSKKLLIETVKTTTINPTVTTTNTPIKTINTPVVNTPVVQKPQVVTPVVSTPVVNTPVVIPAPTTRVS